MPGFQIKVESHCDGSAAVVSHPRSVEQRLTALDVPGPHLVWCGGDQLGLLAAGWVRWRRRSRFSPAMASSRYISADRAQVDAVIEQPPEPPTPPSHQPPHTPSRATPRTEHAQRRARRPPQPPHHQRPQRAKAARRRPARSGRVRLLGASRATWYRRRNPTTTADTGGPAGATEQAHRGRTSAHPDGAAFARVLRPIPGAGVGA